jgi:hypothetical protein
VTRISRRLTQNNHVQMEVHIMKRDLDLSRQLLLDIEARGVDCSVSALNTDPISHSATNGRVGTNGHVNGFVHSSYELDERIRYHLRLLIDGGYLKEVDRTTAGVPCVRLTHDGHELLELARHEPLWREAIYLCQERTGGESMTAIRTFLIRLATQPREYVPRVRREVVSRPRYVSAPEERPIGNRVRYVRVRPAADEIVERPLRYLTDEETESRYDLEYETAFPTHLI